MSEPEDIQKCPDCGRMSDVNCSHGCEKDRFYARAEAACAEENNHDRKMNRFIAELLREVGAEERASGYKQGYADGAEVMQDAAERAIRFQYGDAAGDVIEALDMDET